MLFGFQGVRALEISRIGIASLLTARAFQNRGIDHERERLLYELANSLIAGA
jgi:hypothetical protein